MNVQHWVKSGEFFSMWKAAFSGTKSLFAPHSPQVAVLVKRYRSGAIWTEVRKPFPSVHLVAAELQANVSPLVIHYRVWVVEENRELYDRLIAASDLLWLECHSTFILNQRPTGSWAMLLRHRGISLIGFVCKVDDLSFIEAGHDSTPALEDISARFFRWFLTVVTNVPSSASSRVGGTSNVMRSRKQVQPRAVLDIEDEDNPKI